jgi:hypothetical protein
MPAHRLLTLDPATLNPDDLVTAGQVAKLCPGVGAASHCHRLTVRRRTSGDACPSRELPPTGPGGSG